MEKVILLVLFCIVSVSSVLDRISFGRTPSPSTLFTLPDNYCRCEDDAFNIIYQSRRKNTNKYGSNVWCFDYTIERNPSAQRCNTDDYALNYILITANTRYPECRFITCQQYDDYVIDLGCIGSDTECITDIGPDSGTGSQGIKFTFVEPLTDSIDIFLCVDGIKKMESGLIAFSGVGDYAYKCEGYQVPAFCGYDDITANPSNHPTHSPSTFPTKTPTVQPSTNPLSNAVILTEDSQLVDTRNPTTSQSTTEPTQTPTNSPTSTTIIVPVEHANTREPTASPSTTEPTQTPTKYPTLEPTPKPTRIVTKTPSYDPTTTKTPTHQPTFIPTKHPSDIPTLAPTINPSHKPTFIPTINPSYRPTFAPTMNPTETVRSTIPWLVYVESDEDVISDTPTYAPTESPSIDPSSWNPTYDPTFYPTAKPTEGPTRYPIEWVVGEVIDGDDIDTTTTQTPTTTSVASTSKQCPVCIADYEYNPFTDDDKGYDAFPKPPKNSEYMEPAIDLSNEFDTGYIAKKKNESHIKSIYYSSPLFIILVCIAIYNVVMCLWNLLSPQKQRTGLNVLAEIELSDDDDDDDYYDAYDDESATDECVYDHDGF